MILNKMLLFTKHLMLLTAFNFFATFSTFSQNDTINPRKVSFSDKNIEELINIYQLKNKQKAVIEGYRIQIFFSSGNNSKKLATNVKANFMAKYPEITSYMLYQPPNFKVRVGDYRTKLEAYKVFKQIKAEYPSAFIVTDEIYFKPSL